MHVSDPNRTRARQTVKIKELAEALEAAGFVSLDEKAHALWPLAQYHLDDPQSQAQELRNIAAVLNRVLRKPT